ncbi:hypothetical protein HF1_01910 [Mycoplasma haemofelis str. Langford 1]|uniref:Uncharacterized protein n=1 Tax=Mycoplasma haemofelis (strain Langford 1) TaxID=941640 RepID=E8ZKN3_MYCHL|nr:hypothetical protein [Mycoplasma haemofelis]CBY92199.1 hypothetical protein HF1_01910 [Mycoplasma haemofelis str. Langford 1]
MPLPLFSKIALGSITACGVAATAGWWALTGNSVQHSFKKEFKHAIIGNDEGLWTKKLELLKTSGSDPKNKKLIDAKLKANSNDPKAKEALKKACEEIVDSEYSGLSGDNYSDFKNFCSINNKDKVVNWLDEGSRKTQLKTLKNGTSKLTPAFQKLKDSVINGDSPTTENETGLTQLCESEGSGIFMGDSDLTHLLVSYFCRNSSVTFSG